MQSFVPGQILGQIRDEVRTLLMISDIIRDHTRALSDALTNTSIERQRLLTQLKSADERLKRASTEIARGRTLEGERKRIVSEAEARVQELQQQFDEIEERRRQVLERLLEKSEEMQSAEGLLREARQGVESAVAATRDAAREREEASRRLTDVDRGIESYKEKQKAAFRESLDVFLAGSARRIEEVFAGQEERTRRAAAAESFRRARHEIPEIGDLCDQRDQFLELVRYASVPAVKEALTRELQRVEAALEAQYPGALTVEASGVLPTNIEELYYFPSVEGTGCVILPISENTWRAIEDGNTGAAETRAMKLIWEMISGVGIRSTDGEFRCEDGLCTFVARSLTADDLGTLEGFNLRVQGSPALSVKLCPLPRDIYEGLFYERSVTEGFTNSRTASRESPSILV